MAPLRWEPDGFGSLAIVVDGERDRFDEQDLRLAGGLADITSLALGNARRLSELERFHELVESLDAVFWEADAARLGFTFLGGRLEPIVGADAADWPSAGQDAGVTTWRRPTARRRSPRSAKPSKPVEDRTVEYRIITPQGRTLWLRDMVHVVRRRAGPAATARADGGRHRPEARRAGSAQERAQVLGGVPARAGSVATAPRARRDEEHLPRGGLPRPAHAPHVDPRVGADPRADALRAAQGRIPRSRATRRIERPEARATALGPPRPGPAPAGHRLAAAQADRSRRARRTGRRPRPRIRAAIGSRSGSNP